MLWRKDDQFRFVSSSSIIAGANALYVVSHVYIFKLLGDGKENDYVRCIYQMLIESLVGMKFAVENQADDMHLSVIHQSSGTL